jgi:hypothetical protein
MTTRRETLRAGVAAILAGATTTAPAAVNVAISSSATGPDAKLVELCAAYIELEQEIEVMGEMRTTLEIEELTQKAYEDLQDRQFEIADEIEDELPPRTREGVDAIAKVAFNAVYLREGNVDGPERICQVMAWEALAYLTGRPSLIDAGLSVTE